MARLRLTQSMHHAHSIPCSVTSGALSMHVHWLEELNPWQAESGGLEVQAAIAMREDPVVAPVQWLVLTWLAPAWLVPQLHPSSASMPWGDLGTGMASSGYGMHQSLSYKGAP